MRVELLAVLVVIIVAFVGGLLAYGDASRKGRRLSARIVDRVSHLPRQCRCHGKIADVAAALTLPSRREQARVGSEARASASPLDRGHEATTVPVSGFSSGCCGSHAANRAAELDA